MFESIFIQLSMVMVIVAIVSLIMRLLRQPLIVGYILSGILVGPTLLGIIHDHHTFESFSELGIALLLFIVGLGLDISIIKSTFKPVVTVFLVNMGILLIVSLGAGQLFGFSTIESIIIGAGLIFSSTIVVIKSLSDKKELHRLYGQIAVGVLIIEDIFAAVMLLVIAIIRNEISSGEELIPVFASVAFVSLLLFLAHSVVLPKISKFISASQEVLFIFSLAWAFGIASLSHGLGLSMEVGALFAGISMASMSYAQEIASRLKTLRDFFLVLFFVSLGEKMNISHLITSLPYALFFSFVALAIKPTIVQISLGALGYTRQVGFKAGVHLSQISEFSVILAVLALNSTLISPQIVDILTLTALITIACSSYLMHYDDKLFKKFHRFLSVFERKNIHTEKKLTKQYKFVLIGYHKGGYEFIKTFRDMKKPYIVIDYNPSFIDSMERQGIHHIYGDATDFELLDELEVAKAHIVISTIAEYASNATILRYLHRRNPNITYICHAHNLASASKLYGLHATYVMLPHLVGSQRLSDFIRRHGMNRDSFNLYRRQQLSKLGKTALRP